VVTLRDATDMQIARAVIAEGKRLQASRDWRRAVFRMVKWIKPQKTDKHDG